MRRRALLMGGKSEPNTIIGGVGSVITTKSALATKLDIPESIIRGFEVVGNDVHAKITDTYDLPEEVFYNDLSIIRFMDLDGLVGQTLAFGRQFMGCLNLIEAYFPNLDNLYSESFRNTPSLVTLTSRFRLAGRDCLNNSLATPDLSFLEATTGANAFSHSAYLTFNAPLLSTLGTATFQNMLQCTEWHLPSVVNVANSQGMFHNTPQAVLIDMKGMKTWGTNAAGGTAGNYGFSNLNMGCVIKVHEAIATANAGNPHEAFLWVKANRGATVEFYDDDGNYVSTL